MDAVHLLFANIAFIVLAITLYNMFRNDGIGPSSIKNKTLIFLTNALAIHLCMNFSMNFVGDVSFDLRQVPFIIGVFFGGNAVGGLLFVSMTVHRYLLGSDGFLLSVFISFIVLIAVLLFKRYVQKNRSQKTRTEIDRIILTGLTVIALIAALITVPMKFSFAQSQAFVFNGVHWSLIFLQGIGMLIAMFLIIKLRENIEYKEEIIKGEQLKIISELAASIAHEIRNPLTVVRGFAQLLKKSDKMENIDSRKRYADVMINELDRAESIIVNFLSLSKPQIDQLERFNIGQAIEHVTGMLEPFGHLHQVDIHITHNREGWVSGDPRKFSQCLINIMKNGIEAMPDGGVLTVSTFLKDKVLNIEIRDTGIGMDEQQIKRLGTPYYSTKEKGTGLGMMVTYNIIKLMNGKIMITSKQGEGTSIIIQLPLA